MPRTVDVLDAARMTASSTRETAQRVSEYFGDAGPFSYGRVRSIIGVLLTGALPYEVAVEGLRRIKFDLARKCNLDVAALVVECDQFRGRKFYKLKRTLYPVDRDFLMGIRPEIVIVVDGVPNLVFLQPRKNATPWPYNIAFVRRVLEEVYQDYFEKFRLWLLDTEALEGEDRSLKLVDLQQVPHLSDREFTRRIDSLRTAWRMHLNTPRPKRQDRPGKTDDRQERFDFDPDA